MNSNEKTKGIFIPFDIWTIKNLNINEKLILSDIYNKSKNKDFKGYNKKANTIVIDLNINEFIAKDIFNSLQKKGYIKSNVEVHRNQGSFKRSLPYREIIQENFQSAKRFKIPDDNIFLRNGEKGIFLSKDDIYILNGWRVEKENKIFYSDIRTRFLILILIIRKIAFLKDCYICDLLFARFTIKDISEFTGMTRQSVSKYIKELTEKRNYKNEIIRILCDLSNKEVYQELFNNFGDTCIMTDYRKGSKDIEFKTNDGDTKIVSLGDLRNLYFIDVGALTRIDVYLYKEIKRGYYDI